MKTRQTALLRLLVWVIYPCIMITAIMMLLFILTRCTGHVSAAATTENDTLAVGQEPSAGNRKFVMITIPDSIKDTGRRSRYLVSNYWNNFDFNDTAYCHQPKVTEQAFVNYAQLLPMVDQAIARASIDKLLTDARGETTAKMYAYINELIKKYLYEAGSAMRNDELYIPVAERLLADSLTGETEKERLRFNLKVLLKNRMGEKASDVSYTQSSGRQGRLYDSKSEYTLLMFYDPDCPLCKQTIDNLKNAQVVNDLMDMDKLKILLVYTGGDMKLWKDKQAEIPEKWISGYDPSGVIQKKLVYDLRAVPAIYLLDKDKTVLLKDVLFQPLATYLEGLTTPLARG